MPYRPKRRCTSPGCPNPTDGGPCRQHKKQREKARGSASSRGYGYRWQRYRRRYLAEHPLCERCEEQGHTMVATVVHHIKEATGKHDPLFWQEQNHQALCRECHEEVHRRAKPTGTPW